MKILMISEFFPTGKDLKFSGGVEARTYFVARELSKTNKVFVLTSKVKGTKSIEKMFNFTIYRIGRERNYYASSGDILKRIIFIYQAIKVGKNFNVDVIDATNFVTHFIGKRIGSSRKIPIVAWYPDVWLNNWIRNAGFYGIFGEVLERVNLYSKFDAYIAISKETAKKLKKYVDSKIKVIYCGVDSKEYISRSKKTSNPTVICVSRLTKYKNIETLVYAFAHLSTRIKNVKLTIVGSGSQQSRLDNLINSLKLSAKAKIVSNLPRHDLIRLYSTAHLFCLPSTVEGFGIATLEAAAAGLPYVNSNTEIHREITKNGQGGFLVEAHDPLKFSEKMYTLLSNQKLYNKKSKDAKNLSRLYDWQKISSQTEQVYKSVISTMNY